jgi:signal transduction histidine kinase
MTLVAGESGRAPADEPAPETLFPRPAAADLNPLLEAVSLVSHEVRTPLTLIKGYVSTLLHLDNLSAEEQRHYLLAIEQANTRLTHLVDNILDISIIDAGRLSMHPTEGLLDMVARQTVRQMQAQTTDHLLRVSAPRPLPPLWFDAGRIEQVLVNLVGNAIKYAPEGGLIEVVVRQVDDWAALGRPWPDVTPPAGAWQVVEVLDEGSGLPPEDLPRLFGRFQRGSSRQHHAVRGAGIGLYLCQAIVEAHGGVIWAENRPERGSCFGFALPVRPPS